MSSFLKKLPARETLVAAVVAAIVVVLAIAAVVTIAAGEETACHGPRCPLPRRLVPVQPAQQPHPAVVRVVNVVGGASYYGSGTCVRMDGIEPVVLTCGHLFRDGVGRIELRLADGSRGEARLLKVDQVWDLAVLSLHQSSIINHQFQAAEIAAEYPRQGQRATFAGYGRDGRYRARVGVVRGYGRKGEATRNETLIVTGQARLGDSGGPIFDERGRLVAVLWGTDTREVCGTYCGRIRKFLAGVRGLTPRREDAKKREREGEDKEEEEEEEERITPRRNGGHGGKEKEEGKEGSGQGSGVRGREDEQRAAIGALKEKIGEQGRTLNTLGEKIARAAGLLAELQRAASDRPPLAPNPQSLIPTSWYVGLLAALGWTGPPAVAAVVAARIFIGWRRRRKVAPRSHGGKEKEEGKDEGGRQPLHDDYAKQLNSVFGLSGRSAVADATLGREYDEELRRAAASSDAALATWAKRLRDRVANKFYRIHEAAPSPAEPIQ